MEVNGWRLYAHPLFLEQIESLKTRVAAAAKADATSYKTLPVTKLLATVRRYISETIPANPSAAAYRQGNTLGRDNKHWFRAKFHERYRLFFRFSTKDKVIVYVWINNERTLRQSRARTDPYAVFGTMLEGGTVPQSMTALMRAAREIRDRKD